LLEISNLIIYNLSSITQPNILKAEYTEYSREEVTYMKNYMVDGWIDG